MKQSFRFLQCIEMVAGVSITALGLSCMIKSQLGQTAITAFTQNIADVCHIKGGTILIIFFLFCILMQILLLRKEYEPLQLLQVIVAMIQGQIVNLICYDIPVISDYLPNTYFLRWSFMLVGILLTSYGVAVLFKAELVRNPYEELAMILARKCHMEFSKFRVLIDMFFMALCVVMILLYHLDFTTIREGTWVSMLLLGKSMKYTFPLAEMTSLYQRKIQKLSCSL